MIYLSHSIEIISQNKIINNIIDIHKYKFKTNKF